jgi:phosphoribosylamine--glycine ligase
LCKANKIPTAAYERFKGVSAAKDYVRKKGAPIVVKADGLAAGKGVVVAETVQEAEAAIDMMFSGGLGTPAWEIVIEDCLIGEEASFFALCDGETAIALASAQDHKRVGDGDKGPNTGGMGAYSPAPIMTADMNQRVMNEIIHPTVRALKRSGAPYKGVLFAGLMITKEGPQLIEYNVRFGDPECQVLMLRMMSDLVPALLAARDGQLKNFDLRWYPDAALTVVMAAKGYPGTYNKGSVIEGLDAAAQVEGVKIFHAGTKADGARILANGGRVLNVCARGKTVREAQNRAYAAVDRIRWPDGFCRRDIGWRAIERER